MAVTIEQLGAALPGVTVNPNYINALYKYAYKRDATANELARFKGQTVASAAGTILGKKSPFVGKGTLVPMPGAKPKPAPAPAPAPPPPPKPKPVPVQQLPPDTGSKMVSEVLGADVPISVDPGIAGLLALYAKQSEEEKRVEGLQQELTEAQRLVGGQASDLQKALEKEGVPKMFEDIKQLNLKSAQLVGNLEQFDVGTQSMMTQIENQPISMALITGQQAHAQKLRSLERMGIAAELSSTIALNQAYQGNAQLGLSLAQQAVDMKYQPILNEITILEKQLGFATDKMTRADTKRANVINTLLDVRKTQLADEKQKTLDIEQTAIEAALNGASLVTVNAMREATDRLQAVQIGSEFLGEAFTVKTQINNLAADAATAGAPQEIIDAMRSAPDLTTASSIGSKYISGQQAEINNLAAAAAANGAPQDVIDSMKKAGDTADASRIGSEYLKGDLESIAKGGGAGGVSPVTTPTTVAGTMTFEEFIKEKEEVLLMSIADPEQYRPEYNNIISSIEGQMGGEVIEGKQAGFDFLAEVIINSPEATYEELYILARTRATDLSIDDVKTFLKSKGITPTKTTTTSVTEGGLSDEEFLRMLRGED